jgi:hypothetical protein
LPTCCALLTPWISSPAGVGMSHLSGEVKRLMSTLTKYDQDNYPEMLGRICIINAPLVFKAIWALVKPLLNPRTLSKIQVRRGGVHALGKRVRTWVVSVSSLCLAGNSKVIAQVMLNTHLTSCRCYACVQTFSDSCNSSVIVRMPAALCWPLPVQICQTNYQKDLLEWVAPENLPEWLGGTSRGTLLDDCGPWSDPEVLRRMEGQLPVACKALKRMATLSGTGEVVLALEDGEGYHSPRCVAGSCFFPSISSSSCVNEGVCRHGWMSVSVQLPGVCNADEVYKVGDFLEPLQLVPSHGATV